MCKKCLEERHPNRGNLDVGVGDFAKVKFTDCNGSEYMWVKVERVNGDKFEGELGNDPVLIERLSYGDNVQFEKGDVWEVLR